MNEVWSALSTVFSSKGGTIKLAILGSLIGAILYEMMEAKYNMQLKTQKGSWSLASGGNDVVNQIDQQNETT